VLIEFKLTGFDLSFDVLSPIFSFLFTIEVVTDGRVPFDANNGAPDEAAVVVFTFINRCHDANLWFNGLVGRALVKIILRCTAIAPSAYNLNFSLILSQAGYASSAWICAG
jgi:hypothetical protein